MAERPRRRSSKPDRRVRLPPGTLRSLTTRRDNGPVGNRKTTLAQNEGCWGFESPLGHFDPSPWRTSPEWSSLSHSEERGFESHPGYSLAPAGHRRAQVPVKHPHRYAGSTPARRTHLLIPGSSNGRTACSDLADAGSSPAPGSFALVVKRTSWLPPKEQVQVRFLAGVLIPIPEVWRRHATVRRSKVRFDSSQGYCGRTQSGSGTRL